MKVNDIVIINGDYLKYFVVSHLAIEENKAHLTDMGNFPYGWYSLDDLKEVPEKILRCSLDSLSTDLYNLKSAMKTAGYDTLRGGK